MNVVTDPLFPAAPWKLYALQPTTSPTCLAATIRHDKRTIGADGTTRHLRYLERFYRSADRVWRERVLPRAAADLADRVDETGQPIVRVTARFIMRRDPASAELALVSVRERLIIDVEPLDFDVVGFDGNFETASRLFNPAALDRLKPGRRNRYGRWYETATADTVEKVLWSENLGLALTVVSDSSDGLSHTRMSVNAVDQVSPDEMPWEHRGLPAHDAQPTR
jgi:hypothetical protein